MSIASPLSFYLCILRPPSALSAQVNGSLSDPYMTIPYDNDTPGSITPLPGMTVWFGTTPDSYDLGVVRLRSWNGSNSLSVAENDDVTPYVSNNNYISVRVEWRLWPKYPRILIQGTRAIVLEDYNISYSDQTLKWRPVAVAGPPAVVELAAGSVQVRFVGDRSFALANGASISSWLWTAPGSVEGTSTSQGTEASPVIFTYTSTGQKLVYLQVTDSNGEQRTNYTWVFVVDPNNPTGVAYTDFDAYNDNFDFEQGGGACSFTVHGGATIGDFPNEALVVLASRPTTPGQTTPTGYWPNRDNVHFVGYILGDTVRQNPIDGDVSFQAATVDALMKNLTMFPVSLTYDNSPHKWTQAAHLTPDRAASFLWHYHSTLSLMAPIVPSNYSGLIYRQDFGPGDLYSQLDSELLQTMFGRVVVNHQGVVHHLIDYNLMNNSERSAVTVRKTLHKGVWVNDFNIEERHAYSNPVNVVKASGIIYTGGSIDDVCPIFSEAPGNAPKVYGKEMNYDRLILTSQSDLNIRTGRALAKHTAKYSRFSTGFINDGSFTIAPQELFPSNVEAADNNRGLALTTRLLPRSIGRTFDHTTGHIAYDVGFEPETDGPAGVTVDLPCTPPPQNWPDLPVEEIEEGNHSILFAFSDQDDSGRGKAFVAVAGSVTIGSIATFETGGTQYISVCALSSTKAVVCYRDTGNSNQGTACVLDISGTTVTPGTPVVFETGATSEIDVAALSGTQAIVCYRDGGNSNRGTACILDISGSVVTPGTPVVFETGATANVAVIGLTSTKAITLYRDAGNSNKGTGCVLDVSGSTITPATPAVWWDATVEAISIDAIDSSSILIVFDESGPSSITGVIMSGITTTWTLNTPVALDNTHGTFDTIAATKWCRVTSATQAIAVYQGASPNFRVYAVAITITGIVIAGGTPVEVGSYTTSYDSTPTIGDVNENKAIVFYSDENGGNGFALTIDFNGGAVTENNDEIPVTTNYPLYLSSAVLVD